MKPLALALLLVGFVLEGRGGAAESAPVRSQHVEATLIGEPFAVSPGDSYTVALRLRMDKGWHVYWVNPGDSGYAPKITWTLPPGFSADPIQWPTPGLISQPPLMSYGYEGEAWLLTTLHIDLKTAWPVEIKGHAAWLECAEVCIPAQADLVLRLKPEHRPDPRFVQARAALPQPLPANAATISQEEGGAYYRIEVSGGPDFPPGTQLRFFPFQGDLIDNAALQLSVRTGTDGTWRVKRDPNAPVLPETVSGLLAGEVNGKPTGWTVDLKRQEAVPVPPPAAGKAPAAPLSFLVLLFAFTGGLILNLMPCVLPVLALKVLAMTSSSHGRRDGLRQGLAFTSGVVVSFWVLAGLLLILRGVGQHLGWGFQLQSPPFVVLSAVLFVLIGLNLFGVFEVGGALTAVGGAARVGTLGGSFAGGALAVVVATPCTAPFMGSALGVALAQPPLGALLIFTFLGLGMAAPYLLLAANPAWLRFVPKPGRWMETFKQLLGFPMLATALWLVWVYGTQAGLDGAAALLGVLLVIGLAAWIYGKWGGIERPTLVRGIAALVVYVLVAGALTLILTRKAVPPPAAASEGWEAFTPEKLAALRAEGKPVLVDFTASWCLSCQVNQRVALDAPEVAARFRDLGIARLKADWTSNDPAVTAALAGYGRQSVPLYVLYGREPNGMGAPRFLPEILTPGIVLKALDEVGPAR